MAISPADGKKKSYLQGQKGFLFISQVSLLLFY